MGMRIGILFPPFFKITEDSHKLYGGLEIRTRELALRLAENHEVIIFAPEGSKLPGIEVITNHLPWNPSMGISPYDLEKKQVLDHLDVLDSCDFVVDDTHFKYFHYLKCLAARQGEKAPACLFSWDFQPSIRFLPQDVSFTIVAVSKFIMSELRKLDPKGIHRFRYAYPFIARLYENYDVKEGNRKLILFLARFSTVKGPQFVVQLARDFPSYHFVMLGDVLFTQEPHVAQACLEAGEELDNLEVHFNVDWNTKIKYLQECGAVIAPHIWPEPFGLQMTEALIMGKPVLATALGGAPEIVNRHVGMLVPPHQDYYKLLKSTFKQFIKKRFDPEICRARAKSLDFNQNGFRIYKEEIERTQA